MLTFAFQVLALFLFFLALIAWFAMLWLLSAFIVGSVLSGLAAEIVALALYFALAVSTLVAFGDWVSGCLEAGKSVADSISNAFTSTCSTVSGWFTPTSATVTHLRPVS